MEKRQMNILITGAKGMVGTALATNLYSIKEKKNTTRPDLHIGGIYEYDRNSTQEELEEYCAKADFVFHLAGVNRPKKRGIYERKLWVFLCSSGHIKKTQKQCGGHACLIHPGVPCRALCGF